MGKYCPDCGEPVRLVADPWTFYPRGYAYHCDGCGARIHPEAALDNHPEIDDVPGPIGRLRRALSRGVE